MKLFDRSSSKSTVSELPLLPSPDIILFPHMVGPFFIVGDVAMKSVNEAMNAERRLVVVPQQTDGSGNSSMEQSLNKTGTVARILQVMKLPNGSTRLLLEGEKRVRIGSLSSLTPPIRARVQDIPESGSPENTPVLMRSIQESFSTLIKKNSRINPEVLKQAERADKPDILIDLAIGHTSLSRETKLELLNCYDTTKRLENTAVALDAEIEVNNLRQDISKRVKDRLERNQKEYFLNEQIKEINRELGREGEEGDELQEIRKTIDSLSLPAEVDQKVRRELRRLERIQPMAPEAGILRTYIEWIIELPWPKGKQIEEDSEPAEDVVPAEEIVPTPYTLKEAAEVLDTDHYDMEKPKQRVLEYIAIQRLNPKVRGPILCFVGPPGTGKTSLGRSLAKALQREFTRISLGGIRDEAEIRGHRKTYVGALPGKIIQGMRRLKTINPVFLLDEIDKISSDHRGDPSSALLEVLDPEQNNSFVDHYLEVPYDLSQVVFITTANSLHTIPYALRDRMEIIEVPGYTEYEKARISEQFLIPKQKKENGLEWAKLKFQPAAIRTIINEYTMESGVRNLERQIAAVMRKIARQAVEEGWPKPDAVKPFSFTVSPARVRSFLGKRTARMEFLEEQKGPGIALGMAWTEHGGTLLPVEVSLFSGKSNLLLTGNLGDVMKESARIAHSFLRSCGDCFHGMDANAFEQDMHMHVPEGAIPKDGPSAGITITAALVSALLNTPLNPGWAMTGEITLTGRILPVGGIKEKVLAAHRNGIRLIILPKENQEDAAELPAEIRNNTTFHFPATIIEALHLLLDESVFKA